MQAYISKETDDILSLGIVKTVDLMEFVESGKAKTRRTGKDKIGQAEFYVAEWEDIKNAGYEVLVYTKKGA